MVRRLNCLLWKPGFKLMTELFRGMIQINGPYPIEDRGSELKSTLPCKLGFQNSELFMGSTVHMYGWLAD